MGIISDNYERLMDGVERYSFHPFWEPQHSDFAPLQALFRAGYRGNSKEERCARRKERESALVELNARIDLVQACHDRVSSPRLREVMRNLLQGMAEFSTWLRRELGTVPRGPYRVLEAEARLRVLKHLMTRTVNWIGECAAEEPAERDRLLADMGLFAAKYYGVISLVPILRDAVTPRAPQGMSPLVWYLKFVHGFIPLEPCDACGEKRFAELPYCPHCFHPTVKEPRPDVQ